MVKVTTSDSHRATQVGYGHGDVLVAAGELVPPGTPVSDIWMERAGGKKDALKDAVQHALDPLPDDVDLEALSKPALEAIATQNNVPIEGLSKADLITAIKAAHDPAR